MAELRQRLPAPAPKPGIPPDPAAIGEPLLPLETVADLNELLMVRSENTRRAERAARAKQKRQK